MSTVFLALRLSDNKKVAVKYLKEACFSSPTLAERFRRECSLSLELDHPHVINVFEINKGEKAGYMIMEYLPKGGVDTMLTDPGLDWKAALEIIRQAGEALAYIHGKGIVHRDLKLANLLIKEWTLPRRIHVKLADFGISRVLDQPGLTRQGAKMGTDFYAAPEQREFPEKADFRSDIYSLGVCLYRLVTKRHYPEGDFPLPSETRPEIPKGLDEICMRCLKHDPAERFGAVQELLGCLARV